MTLASRFKVVMDEIVQETEKEYVEHVADHAVALNDELFQNTPKLSGTLANAWRTTVRTPSRKGHVKSGTKIARQSSEEIRSIVQKLKIGHSVFIVNPQDYGMRIEHGWGKKNPPTGFVRPSLRTYTRRLKR